MPGPELQQQVFILSARESLSVAQAVKRRLEATGLTVDIWDEGAFSVNSGYVDDLLNRASYYDFVVAIFSADDETRHRGAGLQTTRDNVIFEFGLFLGRLGLRRTFFLLEEGVHVATDLQGRTVITYKPRANLDAAVGSACSLIRQEMDVANRLPDLNMLPSTALAIGYYQGFIRQVIDAFTHNPVFQVYERDSQGEVIAESMRTLRTEGRTPMMRLRIPSELSRLNPDRLRRQRNNALLVRVSTQWRGFDLFMDAMIDDEHELVVFDYPSTLFTARSTIERLFSRDFLARGDNRSRIEKREIDNFKQTLSHLMPDVFEDRYFEFEDVE